MAVERLARGRAFHATVQSAFLTGLRARPDSGSADGG